MSDLLMLALKSASSENLALSFFLGMCSFLAISKEVKSSFGLGLAVVLIMGLTVPLNQVLLTHLLKPGALSWLSPDLSDVDLSFLTFLCFIGTIAASVQLVEMVLERFFPALHQALGIFLPLIAVNCAILGAALFMAERDYTFAESVAFSLGSGIGWMLALVAFAAIRERLRGSNVPPGLRGLGISLVTTGLLGMAFMAFSGLKF